MRPPMMGLRRGIWRPAWRARVISVVPPRSRRRTRPSPPGSRLPLIWSMISIADSARSIPRSRWPQSAARPAPPCPQSRASARVGQGSPTSEARRPALWQRLKRNAPAWPLGAPSRDRTGAYPLRGGAYRRGHGFGTGNPMADRAHGAVLRSAGDRIDACCFGTAATKSRRRAWLRPRRRPQPRNPTRSTGLGVIYHDSRLTSVAGIVV